MPTLQPCPACARHVRCDEEICPFCGAEVHAAHGCARRSTMRRAVGAAATAALLGTGCVGVAVYGAPVEDVDAGANVDAGAEVADAGAQDDGDGGAP